MRMVPDPILRQKAKRVSSFGGSLQRLIDGMIETMVDLGEPVEDSQVVARIHSLGRPGQTPQEIRARMSGLLAARHFPGLVKAGDCVSVIGALVS